MTTETVTSADSSVSGKATIVAEVGDEEVQITETEDGFEAKPVTDDAQTELYLRGVDGQDSHGFEVPLDADFHIEYDYDTRDDQPHNAAWHTSDDVSDLRSDGWSEAKESGYDGHAAIAEFELVERRVGSDSSPNGSPFDS